MKSIRHRMLTTEVGDVRPIASSVPKGVYERLDDAASHVGVTKAALIRRAVCKYLQEMEERRIQGTGTFTSLGEAAAAVISNLEAGS